jgi:type II secretory pathway component PulF
MQFSYTAQTKEGKTIQGTAEAANKEALVSLLSKQGAKPLVIKSEGDKIGKAKKGKKFS